MANSSICPDSEEAMNRKQELARALERELQKNRRCRTPELANAAGSSCTSPSMNVRTPLLNRLVECYTLNSTRSKGSIPSSRTSRGLSPGHSLSSDSSVSCGLNSTSISDRTTAGLRRSAPVSQERPQPMPNSPMPPSAPNAGQGGGEIPPFATVAKVGGRAPASTTIPRIAGRASIKVPKKRKRQSKKPPTKIVQATAKEFRATVQDLTGFKDLPVAVIRPQAQPPQPERRPQAIAVPIHVDLDGHDQQGRPEMSLTPMIRTVCGSAPTMSSDRAPPATFANYDAAASIPFLRKSPSLNHCMGYDEEATPHFLSVQKDDYEEQLGQLREDSRHHSAPDSACRHILEPKREQSATPTSSTRPSFREVESQVSDSKTKDGIPREEARSQSGGNYNTSSASSISFHFTTQPPFFNLGHRSEELSSPELDLEFEQDLTFSGQYGDLLNWQ